MKTALPMLLAAAMIFAGCSLGSTDVTFQGNMPTTPVDPNNGEPITPTEPVPEEPPPAQPRCDMGKTYTGFAGTMLEAGRVDNDLGVERGRVKPYSALMGEFQRVLGNQPNLITGSGSTFGQDPARWSSEPQSSAVSIYTAYRVAFQGCLTATANDTKYASLPSNTTAENECKAWSRKFWSRDAVQAEVDACVKTAMVDTVKEGMSDTTARRRWAYTCAAVLSSAGFMTY